MVVASRSWTHCSINWPCVDRTSNMDIQSCVRRPVTSNQRNFLRYFLVILKQISFGVIRNFLRNVSNMYQIKLCHRHTSYMKGTFFNNTQLWNGVLFLSNRRLMSSGWMTHCLICIYLWSKLTNICLKVWPSGVLKYLRKLL